MLSTVIIIIVTNVLIIAGALGAFLVLFCGLLYWRQESLLFYPLPNDPALLQQWQSQRVEVPGREHRIEGWWADNPDAINEAVILYFGGNAEDVLHTLASAHQLDTRRMLAANYRGYGTTPFGQPSQSALFDDALTLYDYVAQQLGIEPSSIFVMGRSLGSGVATYVAAQRPVRGVILVTPFDSIVSVAQKKFPFAPARLLLRHPFPSAQFARQIQLPALMLAAANDRVIPPAHAHALHTAWSGPRQLHVLSGAGHNDIDWHPDYYPLINEFLARLSGERLR